MQQPFLVQHVDRLIAVVSAAVALAGGLTFELLVGVSHRSAIAREPSESWVVRDVQWTRSEWPPEPSMGTHVSYDGTGYVAGQGGAATGVYLVFVQLIRSQRLSSRLLPDTILAWVPALEGKGQLVGQDWTFTCTSFERETGFEGCAPELKEPAAHFQVLGWLRFMKSPTEKGHND